MKLTWHIVGKDLRRHRWMLAFLVAIMAAKIGLGFWELHRTTGGPDPAAWWGGRGMATGWLLIALESVVTFALVPAFLHEDPLVGVTADWRTRPISGARLLGAKLLGLALVLGVLPVLIGLPWWLACGYGTGDVVAAALETAGVQAGIVAVALPIAVLTRDYGRFIFGAFLTYTSAIFVSGSLVERSGAPQDAVRLGWLLGLTVLTALTVTVHQFLTRRQGRSLGIAAVGLVWVGAVAGWWPAAPSEPAVARGGAESAAVRGIALEVGKAEEGKRVGENIRVGVELRAHGLPAGYHVMGWKMREMWTWADGTKIEVPATVRETESDANERALIGLGKEGPGGAENGAFFETQAPVPAEAVARLRAEPAAFRAELSLLVRKATVGPERALRAGERTATGAQISRVVAVRRQGGALWVTLVDSRPALARGGFGNPVYFNPGHATHWVVDRASGRAVRGHEAPGTALRVGTVEIRRTVVKFATGSESAAWLADEQAAVSATLVRVNYTSSELLTRVAEVERLRLEP